MRAMKLDRRWWLAIAVVVLVAIAVALSQTVFKKSPEECRPVRDLLDFNRTQTELIDSKSGGAQNVPTVAEDAAYQQWADGLAQRAQNVTDPKLSARAVELADLASQFVAKLPRLRAEASAQAPGAPAPPVVYEMSVLNDQITAQLGELAKACPA